VKSVFHGWVMTGYSRQIMLLKDLMRN